ncbi:MAG: TolC family protein [Bacteroidia bacterium]|nr:TolC family protein [Bacteroidia bacterium]
MKNFKQLVVIFIGLLALIKPAQAQGCQGLDSLLLDPRFDIEVLLPRLDSLNMIALSVNHTVKQEEAAMRSNQWSERYTRWIWAQNLSVFYNYSFGSLPFFAFTDFSTNSLIQVKQGYRAGVNLQLSVFDVMGQRGRVNEIKEKVIFQKHKRDAEAQELRRKMGAFYADMVGYNRLYKGRNEDLLTQTIACQVAEKEFREGTIHMAEYSRQKNVLADAEAAFHESFRFYYSSLLQFEAILGVPLCSIMIKKR